MVYNRQKAIDYLIACMLPHGEGAVFDQIINLNPNQSKMFLWSDCALVAEVFRRIGDTARMNSIKNVMYKYLDPEYNPTPHVFSPLVSSTVFPSVFSDITPTLKIIKTCPYLLCFDYCTSVTTSIISNLSVNRAFLRCINSFQNGNTSDALACWNHGMSFYDGWSVGWNGTRYTSYQVFLQNYAHVLTGYTYNYNGNTITKVLPNHADVMQETNPQRGEGKIRQFYTGNAVDGYLTTGVAGNTETTSLKILADILENGV